MGLRYVWALLLIAAMCLADDGEPQLKEHEELVENDNQKETDGEYHNIESYGGQSGHSTHEKFEKKDGDDYGYGSQHSYGKKAKGGKSSGGGDKGHKGRRGHRRSHGGGDFGGYGSGSEHQNRAYREYDPYSSYY